MLPEIKLRDHKSNVASAFFICFIFYLFIFVGVGVRKRVTWSCNNPIMNESGEGLHPLWIYVRFPLHLEKANSTTQTFR